MKLFYPRYCFDGTKPAGYDKKTNAYNAKLAELESNAIKTEMQEGNFYREIKYWMPDGSVWMRMISLEYMLEYSLEKVA